MKAKKKLDLSAAMNAYLMPYIGVMTILCIFFLTIFYNWAIQTSYLKLAVTSPTHFRQGDLHR